VQHDAVDQVGGVGHLGQGRVDDGMCAAQHLNTEPGGRELLARCHPETQHLVNPGPVDTALTRSACRLDDRQHHIANLETSAL
jgi:hypothetical protein